MGCWCFGYVHSGRIKLRTGLRVCGIVFKSCVVRWKGFVIVVVTDRSSVIGMESGLKIQKIELQVTCTVVYTHIHLLFTCVNVIGTITNNRVIKYKLH